MDETMFFGDALKLAVEEGVKIARKGWQRAGMWLAVETHGDLLPQLVMHVPARNEGEQDQVYGHLPNQCDVLSYDWYVV